MNKLFIEPGSSLDNHTGNWSSQQPVMKNKWPPCGQTCPSTQDIQAWLALASDGHWEAAWRKLTERNPFPAVLGRVCYHPCESACNRKHLDSAVNIHSMERYLGDLALEKGWKFQKLFYRQAHSKKQKIAVVGAGPAGLSCAFQLAMRGFEVTVFDSADEAGGTLNSGIPDYRLPKKILQKEIETILALGIKLELNCRIGEEISSKKLSDEYDAIFLGIGAQMPRLYQNKKSVSDNVMTGKQFLSHVNHGEGITLPSQLVVIGGGNTAIDVARSAVRMGAKVTVVCAQYPHSANLDKPGMEIPSSLLEVTQAQAEGVTVIYRSGVSRLVRSGEHLSGVEISRVDKIHNRHGDFSPVLFEGTEEFFPAGMVIFAIGQEVDWQGLESLDINDKPVESKLANVFVGGDATGGSRSVAAAVGDGFQGAMDIIKLLTGEYPVFETHKKAEVSYKSLNLNYYPLSKRVKEGGDSEILSFEETIVSFDNSEAANEAERCLSCGVCLRCDNCWHFCPDAAVIKQIDTYKIDYDYCKGCGICAQECPSGVLSF